jgi:hypothetical protein
MTAGISVPFSANSCVAGVITSCNRHHLLDRTLSSFFANNSYPLRQLIIVTVDRQVRVNVARVLSDCGRSQACDENETILCDAWRSQVLVWIRFPTNLGRWQHDFDQGLRRSG